jgi:hypothetical protein
MKHSLRIIILLSTIVLVLTAWSTGYFAVAARGFQTIRNAALAEKAPQASAEELRAASALTKLGIPLESDPAGRVRWIEATKGELTDEAMRYLPSLTQLEWLEIGGGKVTAAGMAHLKKCTGIRRLYVHDINLADDPFDWIQDLRLYALSLQQTGVTAKVLKPIKETGTLTVLNLSNDPITDEDLDQVARFTSLEVLALESTKVSGIGLARLKEMKRLNVLNLINCHMGDADLEPLVSMTNLRIVYAAGCNISDDAIEEFKEKCPLLAIFRN